MLENLISSVSSENLETEEIMDSARNISKPVLQDFPVIMSSFNTFA